MFCLYFRFSSYIQNTQTDSVNITLLALYRIANHHKLSKTTHGQFLLAPCNAKPEQVVFLFAHISTSPQFGHLFASPVFPLGLFLLGGWTEMLKDSLWYLQNELFLNFSPSRSARCWIWCSVFPPMPLLASAKICLMNVSEAMPHSVKQELHMKQCLNYWV